MTTRTILLTLLTTSLMLWSCDDTTKKEGCGNGLLDLGEQCDGSEGDATSCAELGYYDQAGEIQCKSDCQWDLSVCTGGRCGDGSVDVADGEECDGANLIGNTCQSLGFSGGTLACDANCRYDLSGCTAVCGNGYVEVGEGCDDGNQANGDGCDASCAVEVGWTCVADSPSLCTTVCGDDVTVGGEACDGNDLGGSTCQSLGYAGGTLSCLDTCQFDESQCTNQ